MPWFAWLAVVVAAVTLVAVLVAVFSAEMRVVSVSPPADSDQVAISAPIRVAFSRQPDVPSLDLHFKMEPDVEGTWNIEGDEALFAPARALEPGQTYTVTLGVGLRGQGDRQLARDYRWQFCTRQPQVLYLGWPEPGAQVRQIFRSPVGEAAERLTEQALGVWDYAVHPQGEAIVYSALRDDGGVDLWRMARDGGEQRVLLECPGAACLNPAWSPDGRQLAYERRGIRSSAPDLDPRGGRIWLLDLEGGEDRPLFNYEVPLHSPVWAPSGRRLAYVSPTIPGLEVYDLDSGELQMFANQWGAPPVWSPDGGSLVVPERIMAGAGMLTRLLRIDLEDGKVVDMSGEDNLVEDLAPAWSPGGGWIAVARQFLDSERWTPGRQIWLTRPDASESYGIPGEAVADYYSFAWRPDGGALAYARADLSQGPQAVPDISVWIFDFGKGESQHIGNDAVLPRWLP